jgi:hypothetical protein
MSTATSTVAPGRRRAATLRLTASSVAPVASGYERSLRPCQPGVSRLATTIPTGGDC